jgi:DNA-binding transcriptional ArsR family regulator
MLLQMLEIDLSGALRIDDPGQAVAFENPLRCRLLVACAHEELSLSQLEKRFNVPLPKLHYHMTRLLDARLLTISRTQPRAGRAIRFYRAIAEKFLVPHSLLAEPPGENWATELRQLLRDENNRNDELSLLYAPALDGNLRIRLVRSEDAGPARTFERWRLMKLNPGQRAALAQELTDLVERYAALEPATGAEMFLVHSAFAPRSPEGGH